MITAAIMMMMIELVAPDSVKKNMNQLIFVIFWFGFACGCDFCQFSFRFAFLQYHAKCVCVISELHITYTHVWIRWLVPPLYKQSYMICYNY